MSEPMKLSGWMLASMSFDGANVIVSRPPHGSTRIPLELVEGFVFANAAIGQKGLRVVVAGGSLHQSTSRMGTTDDPYILPLSPGRKARERAQVFADHVMAAKRVSAGVPAPESTGPGRLRQLAELRDDGIITESDFEAAKVRLLGL